jgi:hypothetical protein
LARDLGGAGRAEARSGEHGPGVGNKFRISFFGGGYGVPTRQEQKRPPQEGFTIMASSPRALLAAVAASVLFVAACGEVVVSSPADSRSPGGGGSTGVVVASSAVSATGSASSGAGGGTCVPQPEGAGGFMQPTCADLAVLAVAHPVLTDADGDGQIEVGETATLQVSLDEIAGVGFSFYPGVLFETTTAGVTVSATDWFYAILPCQTDAVSAQITIGSDVPPGTLVTITARVAMLNHDCPDAYSIEIPFTVH